MTFGDKTSYDGLADAGRRAGDECNRRISGHD